MSVLIKGVKMPKEGCKDCFIVKRGQVFDICPLIKREVNGNVERGGKPNNCPLIEIPPHGDLIDKEVLYNKTAEWEAQAIFLNMPYAPVANGIVEKRGNMH